VNSYEQEDLARRKSFIPPNTSTGYNKRNGRFHVESAALKE